MPPFGERAKAAIARSISPASSMLTGLNSTPNDGATDCSAPHWPVPEAIAASRMTAARVTRGAISLSSSSHFALIPYSNVVKPMTLPPGRAKLSTKPAPTGSGVCVNTIGTLRVACSNGGTTAPPAARMTSGQRDQFRRIFAKAVGIAGPPARVNLQVAALGPAQLLQALQERRDAGLTLWIVRHGHEHADPPHSLALLSACGERPRRRRAAEQRYELASSHVEHGDFLASRFKRVPPDVAARRRRNPCGRSSSRSACRTLADRSLGQS